MKKFITVLFLVCFIGSTIFADIETTEDLFSDIEGIELTETEMNDVDGGIVITGTAAVSYALAVGAGYCAYRAAKPVVKAVGTYLSSRKPKKYENPNKKKGVEKRQPTGERERNKKHPNGEEHSRKPKGNRGRR